MSEKRILCVGLMCVDLIQVCKEYPKEDSDQRSVDHRWQRGGNASNNCTVLAKCGQRCEYFGTMGDDLMAKSTIIVAWGESGAAALTRDGELVESPAITVNQVVDTLGAGDTFVAVTMLCLSRGDNLQESVSIGCKVAGAKVGMTGFSAINSGLLMR